MTSPPSTHEESDREHFDRIADSYTRKDLLRASVAARRLRLLQTLATIPLQEGDRVLEVGCGAGFSARYLEHLRIHYTGVDYSEALINLAKSHNQVANSEFVAANIKEFASDAPFDVIFMIGVLHHFDEMGTTLHDVLRLLKPGGWIAANEPQSGNPFVRLLRAIRKRVDSTYAEDQAQLSIAEIRQLYGDAGLTDIRCIPQGLLSTPFAEVPLYPQWLFSPLSSTACWTDRQLARLGNGPLSSLTWNLIGIGRKPNDH